MMESRVSIRGIFGSPCFCFDPRIEWFFWNPTHGTHLEGGPAALLPDGAHLGSLGPQDRLQSGLDAAGLLPGLADPVSRRRERGGQGAISDIVQVAGCRSCPSGAAERVEREAEDGIQGDAEGGEATDLLGLALHQAEAERREHRLASAGERRLPAGGHAAEAEVLSLVDAAEYRGPGEH